MIKTLQRITRSLNPRRKRKVPPRLSIVVVCYKMDNQIGNTLRSLTPPYQRKIKKSQYEILIVDNGSPSPLPPETWQIASNIRYHYIPPAQASPNPGVALNLGVSMTRGEIVCVMIDGARMVTPGVLHWALRLLDLSPRGVVDVRGWHLGPKYQPESIMEGYTHEVEKEMLLQSRWWENGYRLFEISAICGTSRYGFFGKAGESNCLFMSRSLYNEIGGYSAAFKQPGGGLVNLDFYSRIFEAADTPFLLLGEGTFHQTHGGAATGLTKPELTDAIERWTEESDALQGDTPRPKRKPSVLAGHLPPECARWFQNPPPAA